MVLCTLRPCMLTFSTFECPVNLKMWDPGLAPPSPSLATNGTIYAHNSKKHLTSTAQLNQRTSLFRPQGMLCVILCSDKRTSNCKWLSPLALMKFTIWMTISKTRSIFRLLLHRVFWCNMQLKFHNTCSDWTAWTFSTPSLSPTIGGVPWVAALTPQQLNSLQVEQIRHTFAMYLPEELLLYSSLFKCPTFLVDLSLIVQHFD